MMIGMGDMTTRESIIKRIGQLNEDELIRVERLLDRLENEQQIIENISIGPWFWIVYFTEIEMQCLFALHGIGVVNDTNSVIIKATEGKTNQGVSVLHTMRDECSEQEYIEIVSKLFSSIHSFLTHTSNVSKLLWPPTGGGDKQGRKDRKERGKVLRRILGLTGDNALKNRSLRDHLEHFDERMDTWRKSVGDAKKIKYKDYVVAPASTLKERSQVENPLGVSAEMRRFDPMSNTFTFRGEDFDLQKLEADTRELLKVVREVKERMFVSNSK
jgi:hypothetical protein